MTRDEAFNALITLAREINPNLPADLSGHSVTISASLRSGVSATAYRQETAAEYYKREYMESTSPGPCYGPSSVGG